VAFSAGRYSFGFVGHRFDDDDEGVSGPHGRGSETQLQHVVRGVVDEHTRIHEAVDSRFHRGKARPGVRAAAAVSEHRHGGDDDALEGAHREDALVGGLGSDALTEELSPGLGSDEAPTAITKVSSSAGQGASSKSCRQTCSARSVMAVREEPPWTRAAVLPRS
jgi:hypothetical protein